MTNKLDMTVEEAIARAAEVEGRPTDAPDNRKVYLIGNIDSDLNWDTKCQVSNTNQRQDPLWGDVPEFSHKFASRFLEAMGYRMTVAFEADDYDWVEEYQLGFKPKGCAEQED